MSKYDSLDKKIIYDFTIGSGGIGDCIKFFMFLLENCIKNDIKLLYKVNNIPLERYLKLKYQNMYIFQNEIDNFMYLCSDVSKIDNNIYNIARPDMFYKFDSIIYDTITLKIQDVFEFSNEVKLNANILLPNIPEKYTSIHLRLGDKYLETDKRFVQAVNDVRSYNEETIFKFIENNNKILVFFSDNNAYKLKIKNKYPNILVTDCKIGHTSLLNTTEQQTLDAVTEFYILSNSEEIVIASKSELSSIASSRSGFSIIASKFKNVPVIYL